MFKGNGWRFDNKWGNTPYSFVSYSTPNGPDEYLTQFTLVDIVTQSYAGADDTWNTGMQAMYNDGMLVRYDSYFDTLSVFYYGLGLSLNNFAIGINGLTDNAVFINRSVDRAYAASGSIVRAAISVYGPAATIVSVFDNLYPYTDQDINKTILFDDTYAEQYERYNGKIIRGIAANTEDNFLNRSGHYINVTGTIRYNISAGTGWQYGFQYDCHHNL